MSAGHIEPVNSRQQAGMLVSIPGPEVMQAVELPEFFGDLPFSPSPSTYCRYGHPIRRAHCSRPDDRAVQGSSWSWPFWGEVVGGGAMPPSQIGRAHV